MARTVRAVRQERGWRLVPKRMLEAALAVIDDKQTPAVVAQKFSKPVTADQVQAWADDYRNLDKTGFMARYGHPKKGTGPKTSIDRTVSFTAFKENLRRNLEGWRLRERELEEQIRAIRSEIAEGERMLGQQE